MTDIKRQIPVADTFESGWNACSKFVIDLITNESKSWLPNGPATWVSKSIISLITRKAQLQNGNLPILIPQNDEGSNGGREDKQETETTGVCEGVESPKPWLQPRMEQEVKGTGTAPQPVAINTDHLVNLPKDLTIADELRGTWSDKWKELQGKEREGKENEDFPGDWGATFPGLLGIKD